MWDDPEIVDLERLVIDFGHGAVRRDDGQRFSLRGLEKLVLARLLQTPDELVTYRELMALGWPQSGPRVRSDDSRALMSCLYRLRRKLDLGPGSPLLIETVQDEGLRIRMCGDKPETLEDAAQ